MTSASLQEIKKELRTLDAALVQELCLRLAKYKKENKELLNYLLFEADNEQAYINSIKTELDELFLSVTSITAYHQKKSLRKIIRVANKQIKYSGIKQTEIEVRIYLCTKMKDAKVPIKSSAVLYNLYAGQLKKIESAFAKLPEDLKTDYARELTYITL